MSIFRRVLVSVQYGIMATVLVQGQGFAQEKTTASTLKATMHTFFQALSSALPWSFDEKQFQDAAHRQEILEALRALAQNAESLQGHGQNTPQSFDFLRRTLMQRAQDAAQQYAEGNYRPARFLLQGLTENCFACHSRLPSTQGFDLGKRFLERTNVASLPPRERIRLTVASRQFDTALSLCEALFNAPNMTAADIGLLGIFEDYLKLIIRVRQNFPQAITVLEQFLRRSDVPPYLRDRVTSWVAALKELQAQGATDEELSRARALMTAGQLRNRFPADQQGLVHFAVASSLLHRYIDARPTEQKSLAEAYYLLGVAESYISRSSWISETAFFLETAIRLAPASPIAAQAYDVLNTYILTEYTGSSGLHLPAELQEHLDELRRLRGGS
jgi:hypothetical protein